MRLAVTGKNGQVVSALQAFANDELEIVTLGRPELDLARPETVAKVLYDAKPDVVVSAAAYTAVDRAESEPEVAFAVNRDGARAVAKAAKELGIPVIHLSTDYVFDGTKGSPYVESDPTAPLPSTATRSLKAKTPLPTPTLITSSCARHGSIRNTATTLSKPCLGLAKARMR